MITLKYRKLPNIITATVAIVRNTICIIVLMCCVHDLLYRMQNWVHQDGV